MESIQNILKAINDAVEKFNGSVPNIQDNIFKELQPIIKQLELKNGRLLNNINNLKLIGTLKNKLQRVIVNAEYKQAVSHFVDSFNEVEKLNQSYFKRFNNKYTPNKTLPIIKEQAIDTTANGLAGQGLDVSVIDPIVDILNKSVTTGTSYAEANEQLRNLILSNETGAGGLEKHTRQITTDALNQYNAQYTDVVAQDLNFNWMQYVGSLLTSSREFCIKLTAKRWIHRSELPLIIKGDIDGYKCKISKTTKLPLGMIPSTNPNNFNIVRGGYNCGHQAFWIPDSSVPEEVKTALFKNAPVINVMGQALESANEVDELGKKISNEFGGTLTPINFKTRSSIERKINTELGGDATKVKDAVRNTVVIDYNKLDKAVEYVKGLPQYKEPGARVKVQDGDGYFGYKGVLTNIKTKNGLTAEIQLNSPGMIYAKEPRSVAVNILGEDVYTDIAKKTGLEGGLGHKYYEELRKINPVTAGTEELKRLQELTELSKKYYSNFYGF